MTTLSIQMTRLVRTWWLLLVTLALSATAVAQPREVVRDYSRYFGNLSGAYVMFDQNANVIYRSNVAQCSTRYSPASTFKILNALIALETGVLRSSQQVVPWDSVQRDVPEWNRDHNLVSAIRYSVVPFFQEVARRIGKERMRRFVTSAQYGNMDVSGPIDHFWLGSTLRISADEQVDFLQKFYQGTLPFSPRSIDTVKQALILEQTENAVLRGKTGFTRMGQDSVVGWFVGYLEKGDNVYFFACNMVSGNAKRDAEAIFNRRKEIAFNILHALGLR